MLTDRLHLKIEALYEECVKCRMEEFCNSRKEIE